jgi:hypothetical protein
MGAGSSSTAGGDDLPPLRPAAEEQRILGQRKRGRQGEGAGQLTQRGIRVSQTGVGLDISFAVVGVIQLAAAYLGVSAASVYIQNYSRSAHRAELLSLFGSTSNAYKTLNWRNQGNTVVTTFRGLSTNAPEDAEGGRSSMPYCTSDARLMIRWMMGMEVAGTWDKASTLTSTKIANIAKAMDVYEYFNEKGYNSYAHAGTQGGGNGGPQIWPAGGPLPADYDYELPLNIALWRDVLVPKLGL